MQNKDAFELYTQSILNTRVASRHPGLFSARISY